ncbi:phasin family protein [Pseudomonas syringae]|uniref:Poly(3-hydroxyalkanoate) granule-associated protein PhaI n=1 Tax=Pseudomonas syringae TaxID=317 RepID=A0A085VKX2_PSESX|nr:phasin family protein [Pseudomonas syringae]KFE56085.1 poly(3-hydroxyalkanoate) granule-associated protein PhaI [Pseudomonas syringae]
MAKVRLLKKKVEDEQETVISDVRLYARKIWLAGLGAYSWAEQEGGEYIKELIRTGEETEKKAKKLIDEKVEAANAELDEFNEDVAQTVDAVETRLGKIENAFDRRVASALNRIGIPSRHDVDTLSAKLDGLTALLERVVNKK